MRPWLNQLGIVVTSLMLAQFSLYFAHLRERWVYVQSYICGSVPTVLTENLLLLRTDIMAGNLCHDGWHCSNTADLVTITTLAPRPTLAANTLYHLKSTSLHRTGSTVFRMCNGAISSFGGRDRQTTTRKKFIPPPKVIQKEQKFSQCLIKQYAMKAVEE